MERRRVEGIVEGGGMAEDGIVYRAVLFPSVHDNGSQVVRVPESTLTEAGVDLEGDYGRGAKPLIEATVDIDATSPDEVLPEALASTGRLPSQDDEFTFRNFYCKE